MADYVYYPVVKSLKVMFKALQLRFDLSGVENIPSSGGAVIAINHTSFLDFIFAGIPADEKNRYVRFMAKDSVFHNKVSGPLMRGMKHIPVDRDAGTAAFDQAVDYLRAGELVGIFPEATMSRSFDIKDFKNGAVRMAATAGVPLIPEIVFGGQRMYSYDHRSFKPGNTLAIKVGAAIHPTLADDANDVTEQLRATMIGMLDEVIAAYPKPTDPAELASTWWLPARSGGGAPTLEQAAATEAQIRQRKAAKRANKS